MSTFTSFVLKLKWSCMPYNSSAASSWSSKHLEKGLASTHGKRKIICKSMRQLSVIPQNPYFPTTKPSLPFAKNILFLSRATINSLWVIILMYLPTREHGKNRRFMLSVISTQKNWMRGFLKNIEKEGYWLAIMRIKAFTWNHTKLEFI